LCDFEALIHPFFRNDLLHSAGHHADLREPAVIGCGEAFELDNNTVRKIPKGMRGRVLGHREAEWLIKKIGGRRYSESRSPGNTGRGF
jgi:hypothetical protein